MFKSTPGKNMVVSVEGLNYLLLHKLRSQMLKFDVAFSAVIVAAELLSI